jgi:hypothetical protein
MPDDLRHVWPPSRSMKVRREPPIAQLRNAALLWGSVIAFAMLAAMIIMFRV